MPPFYTIVMYGLVPLFGVESDSPIEEAENLIRGGMPDGIEYSILDAIVMGNGEYVSVEVEVVFPNVDEESELPPREELFPSAEGVSYLAVEAV